MDAISRRDLLSLFGRRVAKTLQYVIANRVGALEEPPKSAEEAGRSLGRSLRPIRPFSTPSLPQGERS